MTIEVIRNDNVDKEGKSYCSFNAQMIACAIDGKKAEVSLNGKSQVYFEDALLSLAREIERVDEILREFKPNLLNDEGLAFLKIWEGMFEKE